MALGAPPGFGFVDPRFATLAAKGGLMVRRGAGTWLGLVFCLIVDHPHVLSQNLNVDPIKSQNLSHARGSAGTPERDTALAAQAPIGHSVSAFAGCGHVAPQPRQDEPAYSIWGSVGITRSRQDRRIPLQALLELRHDFHCRSCIP
jgi:hypothetical protein